MVQLSKWARLDQWRAMQEISAAAGNAEMFDQWALLDPAHAARQMTAELGIEITPNDLNNPDTVLLAKVEAALNEEPEDDRPEWVPENAVIHIDLVGGDPQGRAWVEGAGEVAVDTLLGSDPDTENAWDVTDYDPDALTADGYDMTEADGPFAFIGDALAAILAGSTFVLRYVMTSTSLPGGSPFVAISADANNAIEIDDAGSRTIQAYSYTGPYDRTSDEVINAGTVGAVNALAMTLTASRAEFAVNGSSVYEDTLAPDEFIQTGDSPIVAALVDTQQNTAVRSITIYDPLPSTVGLDDLSETGVINTAPHDLEIDDWDSGLEQPLEGGAIEYIGADTVLGTIVATDDEGNFLTYSLVDGEEWVTISEAGVLRSAAELTPDADVNYTVGVTDNGGLYSEREFTLKIIGIPAWLSIPTMSGTVAVGQTVTAGYAGADNGNDPEHFTVAYIWRLDDEDIPGAINSTYVPQAGDVGHELRVVILIGNSAQSSVASQSDPEEVAPA